MAREHAMNPGGAAPPRVLLVEDDPASALFLAGALEAIPVEVVAAASVAGARQRLSGGTFDLWLFDANLPDGSGAGLLHELRALGHATPALAHTASAEREALEALIAAGFAEVLVKPFPASLLQAAVSRKLGIAGSPRVGEPSPRCGKLPVWDDDAAASALGGNPAHVVALRTLFLAELTKQRDGVLDALERGDASAASAELHRLRAGCGFVGAVRLAAAVDALREQLDGHAPRDRFAQAAQDVLDSAV